MTTNTPPNPPAPGMRAACAARGDWEEVCWVSDDAADYLELSQPLDGGWQLHRQLMLVRKGRLVYLADTVSGNRATDITYTGRIPLADRTTLEPADETWEANLVHRRRQGVVVPLFLPEWRSALTNGSLAIEDRHLAWTASQHGVSLFAPVLIALDRQLLRRPMTWRRLTVAENLAAVPPDVAAGFRVQFGRDQWLIYRSLAGRGNQPFTVADDAPLANWIGLDSMDAAA